MSRFEGYRPASFRGAAFEAIERTARGGRRVDVGEVPFADAWISRDMGARARRFSLRGFVAGAGWREAARALEAALAAPGPGRLVHPTRGEMEVHVERWSAEEDESEGLDYCRYAIDCVLSGEAVYPNQAADPAGAVEAAATAVERPVSEAFIVDWRPPDGEPLSELVEAEAESDIAALARVLRDAASGPALPDVPDGVAAQLHDVEALTGAAAALIRAPADLAGDAFGLAGGLRARLARPFGPLMGLTMLRVPWWPVCQQGPIAALGGPAAPARLITGRVGETVATNRAALGRLMASAAAREAARVAVTTPFPARDDALAARDALTQAVGALETDARARRRRDEALALESLRLTAWDAIGALAADLPRLRAVHPTRPQSARALVWAETGAIAAARDLARRNRVRHPAHLAPGDALQLLERADG